MPLRPFGKWPYFRSRQVAVSRAQQTGEEILEMALTIWKVYYLDFSGPKSAILALKISNKVYYTP